MDAHHIKLNETLRVVGDIISRVSATYHISHPNCENKYAKKGTKTILTVIDTNLPPFVE